MALSDACWIWDGHREIGGYGMINGKAHRRAHRVIYESLVGPIPEGMQLDHTCRQRGCVNPAHLRPVTSKENTFAPGSRSIVVQHAAKTHCPRGHEYTPQNTRSGVRGRQCRPCERLRRADPNEKARRARAARTYRLAALDAREKA